MTPLPRLALAAALAALAVTPALAADKKKPSAILQVSSEPSDAEVSIDRQVRGSTPLTLSDLAPGPHLLAVRKTGFVEAFQTVEVDAQARRAVQVTLEPLRALLLVLSAPTGAEVSVNGAVYGQTPLLLTTLLLGTHRVRIATPGFQPKEVQVELADRTPRRVQLDLTSDSGTLTVQSEPAGGSLLINGIQRGATPCTVTRIPEGEIEVEVQLEGYQPFRQRVRLAAGEVQTLNLPLAARPARLEVVSIPPASRVYVNNEFRGETPLTLAELTPGAYRVRVERPGYDPDARTIELARGGSRTEEFRLSANTGRIELTTEPAGAAVLVDGRRVGETTAAANATTRVSELLAIDALGAGQHEIRCVRKGYFDKTETVAVERGRTATLHVVLTRRFIPDYEVATATQVYKGVLDSITDEAIRLETAPGVVTTILRKDVRSQRPLRDASAPE